MQKSSTPYLDDGDQILINTAELIAHTLVQANSGGGKTFAERRILEQTFGAMPQWILDPEGEMHTLREAFPYILAAPRGGDTVASVKTAPILVRRLLETGASCVIDFYDMGMDERHAFVRAIAEAAMNAPRALWRDVLVAIDEAHRFVPERGEAPSEAASAVKDWMTAGRKRGYAMILAVQRISTLHKSAAAECNNRLIGRTGLDVDQDRAGKALGLRTATDREALAKLKPGTFHVYGPAFCDRPQLVKVGPILTSHGRAARGKAPTPPLAEARAYLAQIGDLPAEAEAELKTVEQLRAKVNELTDELRIFRSKNGGPAFTDEERKELNAKIAAAGDARRIAETARAKEISDLRKERDDLINRIKVLVTRVNVESASLVQMHDDLTEATTTAMRMLENRFTEAVNPIAAAEQRAKAEPLSDEALEHMAKSGNVISRSVGAVELAARAEARKIGENLTAMQRTFLTVLAQHGPLPKHKALLYARYAAGGAVSRCWAEMSASGWIRSDQGVVAITTKGEIVLGPFKPLPVGKKLLAEVLHRLPTIERRLLAVVTDAYPNSIPKAEAVQRASYAAGGAVSRAWAHLSNLNYIDSNRGNVTAAKELCEP